MGALALALSTSAAQAGTLWIANMTGGKENPPNNSTFTGTGFLVLNNAETAQSLGLQESAAAKRYVRALKRLRLILDARPGGLGGL